MKRGLRTDSFFSFTSGQGITQGIANPMSLDRLLFLASGLSLVPREMRLIDTIPGAFVLSILYDAPTICVKRNPNRWT
jgi:hypothetical protein